MHFQRSKISDLLAARAREPQARAADEVRVRGARLPEDSGKYLQLRHGASDLLTPR